MTTIHERSFAGLGVAPFAVMLVVCGSLLLLPTAASPNGAPTMAVVPAADCAAAADRAEDQQFTDDAGLAALEWCDDDDDEDDAPTGSDAAIAVDQHRTRVNGDVRLAVDVKADPWISRTVEGHALRGPPYGDERSSDADFDGNDDDPTPEDGFVLPSASSRATCVLSVAEFFSASSTNPGDLSLRAPPL